MSFPCHEYVYSWHVLHFRLRYYSKKLQETEGLSGLPGAFLLIDPLLKLFRVDTSASSNSERWQTFMFDEFVDR